MAEICHHRKYRRFLLSCCYFEFSYYHRLNQLNCLDVSKVRSFAVALYCSKILLKSRFPLYPPPTSRNYTSFPWLICRYAGVWPAFKTICWCNGSLGNGEMKFISIQRFFIYIYCQVCPSVPLSKLEYPSACLNGISSIVFVCLLLIPLLVF